MTPLEQAARWVDTVWGERSGYFLFAFGHDGHFAPTGKYEFRHWTERHGEWPGDRDRFLADAIETAADCDVYVAPYLRSKPNRKKGSAIASSILYADVDEVGPSLAGFERVLIGPGGLLVDSGNGRHPYLRLPEEAEPAELEQWNRRLARVLDADAGWAENKVLRLPGTFNHKTRAQGGTSLPVALLDFQPAPKDWTLAELAQLLPDLPTPSMNGGAPIVPEMPSNVPARLLARLEEEPDDRSKQSYRFVGDCLDAGLSDAETVALALQHRPTREKYGQRASVDERSIHNHRNPESDPFPTGPNLPTDPFTDSPSEEPENSILPTKNSNRNEGTRSL